MSKLGFNLLAGYDPNDLNPALDGNMHSILLLQEFHDQLDNVIDSVEYPIIRMFHRDGRFYEDQLVSSWLRYTENKIGLQAAADYARSKDKLLWVQGPNEVHITVAYGGFEAERALALYDIGARAVIGNFAVGTPDPERMRAFWTGYYGYLTAMDRLDVEAGVGFHEYGYIWPWTWLGPFQGENIHPDRDIMPNVPEPGELGWLVGRFQDAFYNVVPDVLTDFGLNANLIDNFKIFITEAGLDLVTSDTWALPMKTIDGKKYPFSGWRTCAPYWKKYFSTGYAKMYGRLLQWLDNYYNQFPQVAAVLVFGLGPHHDNDFADFDIGGNNQMVINMMLESEPTTIPLPQPEPEPGPPTNLTPTLTRREHATIARLMAGVRRRQDWIDRAAGKINDIYANAKRLR